MKNKERHISLKQMQQYLRGSLSSEEMYAVENHLLNCRFCQEALEGVEMMDQSRIQEDIRDLKSQLRRNVSTGSSSKSFPGYSGIAAALIFFIIFSYFILFEFSVFSKKTQIPEIAQEQALPMDDNVQEEIYQEKIQPLPVPEETEKTKADENISQSRSGETELADIAPEVNPSDNNEINSESSLSDELVKKNETKQRSLDAQHDLSGLARQQDKETPVDEPMPVAIETATSQNVHYEQQTPIEQIPVNVKTKIAADSPAWNGYTVTGKVIDSENGIPLPGVNVIHKNSRKGAVTDTEGNFLLQMHEKEGELVFSSVGYDNEEYQFNDDDSILVKMEPDIAQLSEVTVIGYGEQEKKDLSARKVNKTVDGKAAFKKYIKENLEYPSEALEKGIEGVVVLSFYVEPSGAISNIKVEKSLGYGCDKEAVRLLKEGPLWKPAVKEGTPIGHEQKVNIRFKID